MRLHAINMIFILETQNEPDPHVSHNSFDSISQPDFGGSSFVFRADGAN
jgi:hypothetical protein